MAKSLVNHIAVVMCEGVGGASEIIAKALRLVRKSRKPLTPNQEANVHNLIRALARYVVAWRNAVLHDRMLYWPTTSPDEQIRTKFPPSNRFLITGVDINYPRSPLFML